MENSYKFKVAGHVFMVVLPDSLTAEEALKPYLPFTYEGDARLLFTLRLEYAESLNSLDLGQLKERMNEEAPYFWIFSKGEKLNFGFSCSEQHPDCAVVTDTEYSEGIVHVPEDSSGRQVEFAINNATMLMYTFRAWRYDTLMTHASVIRYNDGGYMFLGRSGTGKSTHSRMWLENIEGAVLLNDDNPIVRMEDGRAFIYGSPWSGKTPCYKNEVVPLKAIVRIVRAPHNKAVRLKTLQSYASLRPSCSCMKWSSEATDALHKTVEQVISRVPCWNMECLPDAEAARVCKDTVAK